jgi:Flp pilus assembly protein TadD
MTRHRWMLVGVVSAVLLAGCRQVPLRNDNGAPDLKPQTAKKDDKLDSQLSLARLSERHGQNDYAAQVYEAILRQKPRTVEAHHRLAVIASQKQDYETAERHFQQALEYGPRNPQLLADIGYYFYLREQLEDAEKTLRESLAANPQNKAARNNLALVLGEQGRVVEAMEEFQKVVSEAEAHANMGYILVMLGDIPQARVEFNTALSMDNTLRSAAEALIQLEEQMKSDPVIARSTNRETESLARGKAANIGATPSPTAVQPAAAPQAITKIPAAPPMATQAVAVQPVSAVPATGPKDKPAATPTSGLVGNRLIAESSGKPGSTLQASAFERPRKPTDERASYTAHSGKSDAEPLVAPVVYNEDAARFQISDSPVKSPADAEPATPDSTELDADENSQEASSTRSARRLSLPWSLPRLVPKK